MRIDYIALYLSHRIKEIDDSFKNKCYLNLVEVVYLFLLLIINSHFKNYRIQSV